MTINLFNAVKKGLLGLVVVFAMGAMLWLSVPLVWYPKFHKIDTATLTEQVDTLFAGCDANPSLTTVMVPIDSITTPYVMGLESQDAKQNQLLIDCNSGVRLKLWDDWGAASAGLYITREGFDLPNDIAPYATPLDGRVYSWHAAQ